MARGVHLQELYLYNALKINVSEEVALNIKKIIILMKMNVEGGVNLKCDYNTETLTKVFFFHTKSFNFAFATVMCSLSLSHAANSHIITEGGSFKGPISCKIH